MAMFNSYVKLPEGILHDQVGLPVTPNSAVGSVVDSGI